MSAENTKQICIAADIFGAQRNELLEYLLSTLDNIEIVQNLNGPGVIYTKNRTDFLHPITEGIIYVYLLEGMEHSYPRPETWENDRYVISNPKALSEIRRIAERVNVLSADIYISQLDDAVYNFFKLCNVIRDQRVNFVAKVNTLPTELSDIARLYLEAERNFKTYHLDFTGDRFSGIVQGLIKNEISLVGDYQFPEPQEPNGQNWIKVINLLLEKKK